MKAAVNLQQDEQFTKQNILKKVYEKVNEKPAMPFQRQNRSIFNKEKYDSDGNEEVTSYDKNSSDGSSHDSFISGIGDDKPKYLEKYQDMGDENEYLENMITNAENNEKGDYKFYLMYKKSGLHRADNIIGHQSKNQSRMGLLQQQHIDVMSKTNPNYKNEDHILNQFDQIEHDERSKTKRKFQNRENVVKNEFRNINK